MRLVLETTKWSNAVANNYYLVTDNMEYIVGYMPYDSRQPTKFKKPLRWDIRGRMFKTIHEYPESDPNTERVTGSKGQEYLLSRSNNRWVCTCPGFQFRGKCRHADAKMPGLS